MEPASRLCAAPPPHITAESLSKPEPDVVQFHRDEVTIIGQVIGVLYPASEIKNNG
jgi:hypothetical protein